MRWGEKPKGTSVPDSRREEGKPRLRGGGTNDRFPYDSFGGGDDSGSNEDGRLSYRDRLMRCRLGLGLSMISILMLFIALTSVYLIRQHATVTTGNGPGVVHWQKLRLPPLLIFNTILLLISSVTLELARRRLLRHALFAPLSDIPGIQKERSHSLPWLAITVILGIGFHAIHLTVGVVALFFALGSEMLSWKLETRCLVVDVTSWYWHFMAILWIYIYGVMFFSP